MCLLLIFSFSGFINAYGQNYIRIEGHYTQALFSGNGAPFLISGAQLGMYSPEGRKQFSYSNSLLGNIASVDASNPMKIFVFYRELSTGVFLNQQLAELGRLELSENGEEIIFAAGAGENQLALYDAISRCLILKNFDGKEINRSEALTTKKILRLVVAGSRPILLCSDKILIFDRFGNVEKSIALSWDNIIYADQNRLIGKNGSSSEEYLFNTNELKVFVPRQQLPDALWGSKLEKYLYLSADYAQVVSYE